MNALFFSLSFSPYFLLNVISKVVFLLLFWESFFSLVEFVFVTYL